MNIIIEPHCDDAYLGCHSLLKMGMIDKIITVADCGEKRKQENINMEEFFGIEVSNRYYLNFPDGKLIENTVNIYKDIISRDIISATDIVFIPSSQEFNTDHKAISGLNFYCKKIIEYFVWNRPATFDILMKSTTEKTRLFEQLYHSQVNDSDVYELSHTLYEYFKVRK